jgi:hypothetical protein
MNSNQTRYSEARAGGLRVISHRARLDVPIALVLFVSGLLATRRREVGTR